MKLYTLIFCTMFLMFNKELVANEIPTTLNVCGDGAEWPPYMYWKRDLKGLKTKEIIGLSVELLSKAVNKSNINIVYSLPPWKRCLAKTENGDQYSIALDSSFSKERNEKFVMTEYYYEISPMLFFVKDQYPDGFPSFTNIKSLLDLGNICGLSGYNYEGFFKGLQNKRIDRGTKDFQALAKKTISGGCVAFLARYEILKGFKKIGQDFGVGSVLGSAKLPNVQKEKFYMLISKKIAYSEELKKILDVQFKKLRNDKTLFKKYLD